MAINTISKSRNLKISNQSVFIKPSRERREGLGGGGTKPIFAP